MKAGTYFPKVRRMLLFLAPLIFNTFLASFHAASRAPCSYHSVSSWDRSSNFGALGLCWWGSPGQIYPSEGFWSRTLVWRAIAFVNFTRWIGFCMSELFRKIDFGGFMWCKTQPNCRAFDDRRPTGPCFNHDRYHAWHRVSPVCRDFCHGSQQVAVCFRADHSSLTWLLHFCLLLGCSSPWRCA